MQDFATRAGSGRSSSAAPDSAFTGGRTAVLIVNTGSPSAPTREAVAQYLLEFLGDRRVVELPSWFWQPLLRGIIIPRRAAQSAARYKSVWTEQGSPLMAISEQTARRMQQALGEGYELDWAMCYGTHRVPEVLARMARSRPDRLVVLPMFAQYATQTTEAVFDALERGLQALEKPLAPEGILLIESFYNHPRYIEALARNVRRHWSRTGPLGDGDVLLMSFHGIPQASSDRGDPYEKQCYETARLLAQALGLADAQYRVAFQSKFGRAKWLEPSAVDAARALAREGVRRLDVICPGFSSDCLETLEEIAVELRGIYLDEARSQGDGEARFHYIEALNVSEDAVALYAELVREAASGRLPVRRKA